MIKQRERLRGIFSSLPFLHSHGLSSTFFVFEVSVNFGIWKFQFSECVCILNKSHSEVHVSVRSRHGVVIPLTPSVAQCCDGFMSILLCVEVKKNLKRQKNVSI